MKILQVVSSLKKEHSQSSKLSDAIVERLREHDPSATVVTRNLSEFSLPHFSDAHFNALNNIDKIDTTQKVAITMLSDRLIDELLEADTIIIGVPMYNLSIPSVLKSWIDFITRAGKTFKYTPEGAIGLIENKKVYLAIASGGVYSAGPRQAFDFTEPYLKAILGFLGLTDVHTFRVEGLAIPGIKDIAQEKAIQSLSSHSHFSNKVA